MRISLINRQISFELKFSYRVVKCIYFASKVKAFFSKKDEIADNQECNVLYIFFLFHSTIQRQEKKFSKNVIFLMTQIVIIPIPCSVFAFTSFGKLLTDDLNDPTEMRHS